jgi:glycosyltransferase involved in cell wall biosynthesis
VGLQLFNVLLNFLFRQKMPRSGSYNPERISVLIPARNEEANIGSLLETLHQMGDDRIEIIVYDDCSSDQTAQIVQHYSGKDARIQLIQSGDLPDGWLGKNHACHQLALRAKGSYFLFIDADVNLHGTIIANAVDYMKKHKLGLLSVFPKQIQVSAGEKFSVPLMNYILLTLLPLIFVRVSPFTSHSAANGQFMLFDADIYKKLQPHLLFRESPVEDIVISRFCKKQHIPIACITGEERIECRMYNSYTEALNGFSKNIFMFFGNVPVLAFLFWICAVFGIVPFIILQSSLALVYLAIVFLILLLYASINKQHIATTILFFPIHLIFMLHVMMKGLITKKKKNHTWKGRNIFS